MCGSWFSPPSPPSPPPPVRVEPVVSRQPKLADEGVRKAADTINKRAKLSLQRGGTLITGPGGLSTIPNINKKTLLGQ